MVGVPMSKVKNKFISPECRIRFFWITKISFCECFEFVRYSDRLRDQFIIIIFLYSLLRLNSMANETKVIQLFDLVKYQMFSFDIFVEFDNTKQNIPRMQNNNIATLKEKRSCE